MYTVRARRWVIFCLVTLVGVGLFSACQTLREVANLRNVQFRIDRVSNAQLSGVSVNRLQSFEDLNAIDVTRLGSAVSRGEMPFSFTLHVEATNPESNSVDARLTEMEWTLLLQDRETISGTLEREVVLSPGTPENVPVDIQLDLVEFFDQNLRGLVDLAVGVGGQGPPSNIKLQVQPTIQTRVGPMRYPNPITVVNEDVGTR